MHAKNSRFLAVILFSLLFTACGGGGSTPPPANQAPTVTINETGSAMELTTVTLTANAEDPNDDNLAFAWTQTAGIPMQLTGADSAEASFTAPKVKNSEALQFQVTVEDGKGETATASVDITITEANGLVYSAVEERPNVEEIYFHHPAFETPRKLHGELELTDDQSVDVLLLETLPDHEHIVYVRRIYTPSTDLYTARLYIAAIDGTGERDVTGSSADPDPIVEGNGSSISNMAISPDGQWIAFLGDMETDEVRELFVLPVTSVDGSDRTKVSGDITASNGDDSDGVIDGDINSAFFYWSPDSARILFAGDLQTDNHTEIFAANVETGERILLSRTPSIINGNYLYRTQTSYAPFSWSPDGAFIATMEMDSGTGLSLHVVRPDGTDRRTVAENIPTGPDEPDIRMRWSSTGRLAFAGPTVPAGESNARDLYIYTPDAENPGPFAVGGTSAHINPVNGLPDGEASTFDWSPDGENLAFSVRQDSPPRLDIFIVPDEATSANEIVRINDATERSSLSGVAGHNWTSSSGRLTFWVNGDTTRLFSNTPDGTSPLTLSGPMEAGDEGVGDWTISLDNHFVAFEVEATADNVKEVQIVSVDGNNRRAISGSNVASDNNPENGTIDGDIKLADAGFSPDGSLLALYGDPEQYDLRQIYIVSVNSADGSDRQRISNSLATDADEDGRPDGYVGFSKWVGPEPAE